jgi:hypothetical protein
MAHFLAIVLAFPGWCAGEPPAPRPHNSIPGLPRVDPHQRLQDTRRAIAIVESTIQLFEEDLRVFPNTPDRACKNRIYIDKYGTYVSIMKKEVQVLEWGEEQRKVNPGPATEREIIDRLEQVSKERKAWRAAWNKGLIAPPPREIKKQHQ